MLIGYRLYSKCIHLNVCDQKGIFSGFYLIEIQNKQLEASVKVKCFPPLLQCLDYASNDIQHFTHFLAALFHVMMEC